MFITAKHKDFTQGRVLFIISALRSEAETHLVRDVRAKMIEKWWSVVSLPDLRVALALALLNLARLLTRKSDAPSAPFFLSFLSFS